MEKISVITVCFNAEAVIEDTLKSVYNQDYDLIEYIIIDGKSQDRTMDIIKSYMDIYASKENVNTVLVSEQDNGIYDAMNKGVNIATGDWVIFMNAGDLFYCNSTISQMFYESYEREVKGIYGDTERFTDGWKKIIKAKPLESIKKEVPLPFCHQSVFVRTEILKQLKYNTEYKQAADYDFFLRCYLSMYIFVYKDIIVSRYLMGGVSEKNTVYHLKEKLIIREKNKVETYSFFRKQYLIGKLRLKQIIKKIAPKCLLKRIRGY